MEAQHNGSGILQILGRNFESGRHDGERNRQQACALVYPSLRRQAARPLELHCVYSLSDTPQNDTSEKGEVTQQSREQKIRRSALLARAAFCAGAVLTKGHFAFACYSLRLHSVVVPGLGRIAGAYAAHGHAGAFFRINRKSRRPFRTFVFTLYTK